MRSDERPDDSEIRWLLQRVEGAAADQPSDGARDGEWEAWAAVVEVQATLVGWASRDGDVRQPGDVESYTAAGAALGSQQVRELVGQRRIVYFERLVELLYDRLR